MVVRTMKGQKPQGDGNDRDRSAVDDGNDKKEGSSGAFITEEGTAEEAAG